MPTLTIPNNWTPRWYQRPLWDYLEKGGKRAVGIWHRRAGKDEVCLHKAAVAAFERPATYWHMLPEYSQGRKAIWAAVNPHTGIRRIDEAFPHEIRESYSENEMFIRFKTGATWQVVGSDSYNSTVGSPPAGVIFSEWSLSNPAAWGYIAPILEENGGWAAFITTPRGKNHAHGMLQMARKEPGWFAQVLNISDTRAISVEAVERQRREYSGIFGPDAADALIEQEYYCSFDAAVLGAYYAKEMAQASKQKRIGSVPHDPAFKVYTAWDIGRTDDTSIWFYQVIAGEVRVIDFHTSSLKDVAFYCGQLLGREIELDFISGKIIVRRGADIPELKHRKAYVYARLNLPHDARAKTLASSRSVIEQLLAVFGADVCHIVPNLKKQDGIQAARLMFPRVHFDEDRCEVGIEALKLYRREWDEVTRMFKDNEVHDWTSHPADAWRYLALSWQEENVTTKAPEPPRGIESMTMNEMWELEQA